jgi:crossover junction endodeoxyribonuclease RuvC
MTHQSPDRAEIARSGHESQSRPGPGLRVIGLDLSLASTGVASNAGWVHRIVTKPNTGAGHFDRLRTIRAAVLDHVRGADLVMVEGLSLGSQTGQHMTRAGMWHLVMEAIDAAGIPWAQVSPAGVKQYATGKGNASKDLVLASVIRRFPAVEVSGNDEADALVLAAMGADHCGQPMAEMPELHRKALRKVLWPEVAPRG